jgi:uncharacterized membrane protein YedE/YeeE
MDFWPFWVGAPLLAAVMLGHWLILGRQMAVSGRFSALIDRMRFGADDEPELSNEEILAALAEVTAAEFGEEALSNAEQAAAPATEPLLASRSMPPILHVLFFGGLMLGGFLAAQAMGHFSPGWVLRGEGFAAAFGSMEGPGMVVLLVGGIFVGAGTRMAGGCTTGHGLCGLSRFQTGSALATVAFFGAGVVTALVLGVLS